MAARVLWHEWFPAIWLDEHQQGASGPRIFTMPATDPINPNVDPLIYRLNGVTLQRINLANPFQAREVFRARAALRGRSVQ